MFDRYIYRPSDELKNAIEERTKSLKNRELYPRTYSKEDLELETNDRKNQWSN